MHDRQTTDDASTSGSRKRTVVQPEEFWFDGKGRHKLQGWVLPGRARAASKGPGGPVHPRRSGDAVRTRLLPRVPGPGRAGYTVFYSNPRGGTGYTEKHLAAIVDAWGTIDYDDLMTFTDEASERAPRSTAGGSAWRAAATAAT